MALSQQMKQILLDPETSATVLLIAASDLLGPEWLNWDPMTIRMEMQEELGSPLKEPSFNKLLAARELVTTDGFYTNLPDFIRLCNALYNGSVSPHAFDPADAGEIAWAITESLLIWPPDPNEEEPFTDQILEYIGKTLDEEGIMTPPDVLRLGILNEQTWEKVQATYSDDPSMFNAIYDKEREKTDEINAVVKARLRRLLETLDALPLRDGDATDSVKRMLGAIQSKEEEGSKLKPI